MTAEIAVLNANGIALAADSAVTIGDSKIFNSASKLFALSNTHPVGVMVFGGASIAGVPWETIIKYYRETNGSKAFDGLGDYATDFLKFLQSNNSVLFPENTQLFNLDSFTEKVVLDVIGQLDLAIEEGVKNNTIVDEDFIDSTIYEICKNTKEDIKDTKKWSWAAKVPKPESVKIKKFIAQFVREKITAKEISKKTISALNSLTFEALTREVFIGINSGVVIAGFGSKDIFPSVVCLDIEGLFAGLPRARVNSEKSFSVGTGADCSIIPYAQDEMVTTFMQGLHPSVRSAVEKVVQGITNEVIDAAKMNPNLKPKIIKKATDFLNTSIQESQIDPVLQLVQALPKDQLGEMAETLVNLSIFKKKVTNSLETVGGPIDVAVITKGDGFIWTKRKHYFQAELNQNFFYRQMRKGP